MKKPKINLSGEAIKEFFINHGEKVGGGIAAAVMIGLIVLGLSQKRRSSDDAPEKIQQQAELVRKQVEDPPKTPVVPVAKKYTVAPVLARIDEKESRVVSLPKVPGVDGLGGHSLERKPLREMPTFFAIEELQAFQDRAPILFKGAAAAPAGPAGPAPAKGGSLLERAAGGGGSADAPVAVSNYLPQGRNFIMITGLIPLLKQQREYDSRFADADSPAEPAAAPGGEKKVNPYGEVQYRVYAMERVEVVNGKEGTPTKVDLGPAFRERNSWAVTTEDVVPSEYLLNSDAKFNIPLAFPLPPLGIRKWDARAGHPKLALKSDKTKEAMPVPAADPKEVDPFGNASKPKDPKEPIAAEGEKPKKSADIEYKLFRFWDWLVEPGKTYRYRVQLQVVNPNFKMPDRFLANPEFAKAEVIPTPWSEWTPPVTIERDHQIYLTGVDYDKIAKDAVATVTCVTWDKQKGMEFVHDFKLQRGEFAMFQAPATAPNPAGGPALDVKDFKFEPRMLLVDYRNGKSSPDTKKHDEAAEVVLWDADANKLVVRRQAFDLAAIEAARSRYTSTSTPGGPAPAVAPPPAFDPGALLITPPTGPATPATPKGGPRTPSKN